jgi:hypothetical protein
LPELKEYIPEIKETTRVRTRRGYHYYFSLNGEQVKSTNSLFGRRLELKSNGNYVVAPPSIIKAHQYVYEIPLSEMLPIPKILIKKDLSACGHAQAGREPASNLEYRRQKTFCRWQVEMHLARKTILHLPERKKWLNPPLLFEF